MRRTKITRAATPASLPGVAVVAMLVRYHPIHNTSGRGSTSGLIVGVIIFAAIFGFSWLIRNRRRRS